MARALEGFHMPFTVVGSVATGVTGHQQYRQMIVWSLDL